MNLPCRDCVSFRPQPTHASASWVAALLTALAMLSAGCGSTNVRTIVPETPAAAPAPQPAAATAPASSAVVLRNVETVFQQYLREVAPYWQTRSAIDMRVVCMRAAGWDNADYETLMTVSGYGPSFCYHIQTYQPQYFPPGDVDGRIARATGFGWEWTHCDSAEDYWQALKNTIDSGRPAQAHHLEDILLIGYQDAPRPDDRMVRPLGTVFIKPDQWWTWQQFEQWFADHSFGQLGRTTGPVVQASPQAAAVATMNLMLQLSQDDPRAAQQPGWADVKWGLAGLEAFAADVTNASLSPEKFYAGWLGCHAIYPQISGRYCSAVWLEKAAPLFAPRVQAHMREAAAAYERACGAWQRWEAMLGHEGLAPRGTWADPQRRRAGGQAVRRAIDHEQAALEEIKKALATVGE